MLPTESTHPWLACRASTLALCLAAWRGAAAQPPAGAIEFGIPAGPLGQTLLTIGRRTGTMVSFKPGVVGAYQAPAIQGHFTRQQALELALAATGLTYRMTPSGVVTVVVRD